MTRPLTSRASSVVGRDMNFILMCTIVGIEALEDIGIYCLARQLWQVEELQTT